MRALLLHFLPLLFLAVAASGARPFGAVGSDKALAGGWNPIRNPNSPRIRKIAAFAVAEQNMMGNYEKLKLRKVVSGEYQVVEGKNYRLVLEATAARGGGAAEKYKAEVWEKPWVHFKKLVSFEKIY